MDLEQLDACLLSKPGATKAYQPAWDWWCYWVGGKMFAAEFTPGPEHRAPYAGRHLVSLKCDPLRGEALRAAWPDAIFPGFYSDKRRWISVDLDGGVPNELMLELCEDSYDLVFAKLTKRAQREILGEAGVQG